MSNDSTYYAARAVEARRLAMASSDEAVRRIHLEMAAQYAALAGADASPMNDISAKPGQQIA